MSAFKPASDLAPRQLAALWHDVFGDPPDLAEDFLRRLPRLGFGWAACENGRVLGAAYGVDALTLAEGKCLYLYAVAVRPEARGRGLGAALSRAVFETGRERGAVYRCTEPAEPSLFGWYRRILGVDCVLRREEITLYSAAGPAVRPIAPEEYAARREALLADKAHICYSPAAMGFEAVNCRIFGGGLYAVGGGVAAASVEDGAALVRECLGPGPEQLAASVGAALGCERVTLLQSGDTGAPFLAGDTPLPPGTVWNLAFD